MAEPAGLPKSVLTASEEPLSTINEHSPAKIKQVMPSIDFEETHLTIGLESVRYKISLRILHTLFLKTASLSRVVTSVINKRPALAALQDRLHDALLDNASKWDVAESVTSAVLPE